MCVYVCGGWTGETLAVVAIPFCEPHVPFSCPSTLQRANLRTEPPFFSVCVCTCVCVCVMSLCFCLSFFFVFSPLYLSLCICLSPPSLSTFLSTLLSLCLSLSLLLSLCSSVSPSMRSRLPTRSPLVLCRLFLSSLFFHLFSCRSSLSSLFYPLFLSFSLSLFDVRLRRCLEMRTNSLSLSHSLFLSSFLLPLLSPMPTLNGA